jgi:hypothetical protein
MSLNILNNSGNYTSILNIFDQGTENLLPYYNVSLTFTTLLSGIDPSLNNSPTDFKIGGIDLSSKYLASWRGAYTEMTSADTVNILNTNLAYRYVNFFLQSPGGNGGPTPLGSGGSGAFVFGRIDLLTRPANNYKVFVPQQTNSTNPSYISFDLDGSLIAEISCTRGINGLFNVGGAGGTYTAPTATGITYKILYNGIKGANGGGSITKNPYINANTSYYNSFQPITSSDDTLYGAGGNVNSSTRIGKPGFCYVWFTR